MKLLLFLCFLLSSLPLFSQSASIVLPDLLPPSPEVSAMTKGATLSSVMHSGAAAATIPIYEINIGGFKLPISLNYASTGFKPQEMPSRVGCGWNLAAGGVISRIVKGHPDDDRTFLQPTTGIGYNAETFAWIQDLSSPGTEHDTQPDEWSYSVNGLSGKFIIKRDGTILPIPRNNLKIEGGMEGGSHIPTEITLTDEQGIKYIFGDDGEAIEETVSHSMSNGNLDKQHIKTAWNLSKVILPTGQTISFMYKPLDVVRTDANTEIFEQHLLGGGCAICPVYTEHNTIYNSIHYTAYCLRYIVVPGIERVNFSYSGPYDLSGINKLDEITVTSLITANVNKDVKFTYDECDLGSSCNSYLLTRVSLQDLSQNGLPEQNFKLEYNDHIEAQPGTGNYGGGVDFLGFANAGGIPSKNTYLQEGTLNEGLGIEYNKLLPNGNVAQNKMLKKITYPTGGSDSYFYEPNLKTFWDSVPQVNYLKAHVEGAGDMMDQTYYSSEFSSDLGTDAEIYIDILWTGGIGDPPIGTPEPKTAIVSLINTVTGATEAGWTIYGYHSTISGNLFDIATQAPHKIKIIVKGVETYCKANIVYRHTAPKAWEQINIELCGVRVRKIMSHDPVSNRDISKYFWYRQLLDTLSASAVKQYVPNVFSSGTSVLMCPNSPEISTICNSNIFSRNSISATEINQAAGVVYKYILESDDSSFAHGCVEHHFKNYGGITGGLIMGNVPTERPTILWDEFNGKELSTNYYNADRQLIKKVENSYSNEPHLNSGQNNNFIVSRRYDPPNAGSATGNWSQEQFAQFDVYGYDINDGRIQLDMTTTTEYDLLNNTFRLTTIIYTYDHPEIIEPTAIVSMTSEEDPLKTTLKYPIDYVASDPYNKMIQKNIIDPVVEQSVYKGDKLLYTTTTNYMDYDYLHTGQPDGKVLVPETIEKQKGNNMLGKVQCYQYDKFSNLLEVSKENDTRISYVWDYNYSRLIAEVRNASIGEGVAYTSFEADGHGGWNFTGIAGNSFGAVTGKKAYSLSGGDIKYGGMLEHDKMYIVTYWKKDGTGDVLLNGTAGNLIISKNGWSLYKHELVDDSGYGFTLSGSAIIDELRLYPRGAFMKTFTYIMGVGVSEISDENSIWQKYEYDAFNRVIRIRDWDNHIVKQTEYMFGQQIAPCAQPNADWQPTGNLRCKYNLSHNVTSIIEEREELDHNNCSITYNTKHWVFNDSPGGCPLSSCLEPEHKWIVNVGCVPGTPTNVVSEYRGNMTWHCTFQYVYPDGSMSSEQSSFSDSPCINQASPY